jgi:dextranase
VVLAAYVCAFKDGPQELAECALLFLQAAIFASGGYHIELGEHNAVLCDPYFVEHAVLRPCFERTLRNWYDFIVRYADLLYDPVLTDVSMTHAGGINEEYVFSGSQFSSCGEPGRVWTIVKEMPGAKVIHLINLTDMASDRWNEGKPAPAPVRGIAVRVLDNERAQAVWLASPDRHCCRMEPLLYAAVDSNRGRVIEFIVPELVYWNMVYIKTEL